jgi:hypothetical protein
MTTAQQEQLYNEIIKYYDFADKLINIVEESKDNFPDEQIYIIEAIVENLEECTDELTTNFIEFVKNRNNMESKEMISLTLNRIIVKIEQCRNQIYNLYKAS